MADNTRSIEFAAEISNDMDPVELIFIIARAPRGSVSFDVEIRHCGFILRGGWVPHRFDLTAAARRLAMFSGRKQGEYSLWDEDQASFLYFLMPRTEEAVDSLERTVFLSGEARNVPLIEDILPQHDPHARYSAFLDGDCGWGFGLCFQGIRLRLKDIVRLSEWLPVAVAEMTGDPLAQ
jgi:hypothetical protein